MYNKNYRALVAAVEMGSLTKAARALNYTQSGMTHMMDKLEADVGFPIIERGHYGIKLTPAGEQIIPYIRQMLDAGDALEAEIDAVSRSENQVIRVASYASMIMSWMPSVVQRFGEEYPRVNVEMRMASSVEEMLQMMEAGQVDVVFCSRQESSGYSWIHLKNDPLYAVLPPEHPAAGKAAFRLADFEGMDFCMPPRGGDNDVIRALEAHDIKPNIIAADVDDASVIALVEHGMAVSMMAGLVLESHRGLVSALPLEPACYRELGMAVKSFVACRGIVKKFMKCAKSYVNSLEE